jgi:hypothetical protein
LRGFGKRGRGAENKVITAVALLGTLQGSYSKDHIAYYFDEFTFRFNRRKSKSRGMMFYRLLQNAVHLQPITYADIIKKQ